MLYVYQTYLKMKKKMSKKELFLNINENKIENPKR